MLLVILLFVKNKIRNINSFSLVTFLAPDLRLVLFKRANGHP